MKTLKDFTDGLFRSLRQLSSPQDVPRESEPCEKPIYSLEQWRKRRALSKIKCRQGKKHA